MKRLLCFMFLIVCTLKSTAQILSPDQPVVLGRQITFHSHILSEDRKINVYLPPEYTESDTGKFPVVYLLDGGIDEDFIHIVGLYQFNSFPWIQRVAPSIVVGIVNINRMRDFTYETRDTAMKNTYTDCGHSAKFMDYIEKELQPLIARKFRVSSSRTIIGQSLGGLLATQILLERPSLFNRYLIISPSLWWDDGSLLEKPSKIFDSSFHQTTNIFIAAGREGLTPGTKPHVMEVDANLLAEKFREKTNKFVTTCFDYLPKEDHATILHQAVYDALCLKSNCICK